jgi:hypothetical protein
VIWAICFVVAIGTFKNTGGLSYTKPIGLFITYLVYPLIVAVIYIVSQLVLVIRTLDDRWVIGDIVFGVGFYAVGCILLLAFSVTICDAVSHYIDGVFFFTLCMLFTVMMIYKYWDCEYSPPRLICCADGQLSPRRIWNSLLVPRSPSGRSRTLCLL